MVEMIKYLFSRLSVLRGVWPDGIAGGGNLHWSAAWEAREEETRRPIATMAEFKRDGGVQARHEIPT